MEIVESLVPQEYTKLVKEQVCVQMPETFKRLP